MNPTTYIDGVALKIYEECDILEDYGHKEEADAIREIVFKIVGWKGKE